jgi:hypothetical protein
LKRSLWLKRKILINLQSNFQFFDIKIQLNCEKMEMLQAFLSSLIDW